MNEALIVILVFLWAVALLPSVFRSGRSNTRATVGGFERAMDVLKHNRDGRYLMVPDDASRLVDRDGSVASAAPGERSRHDPTLERRRRLFTRLVAMTGASLLFALVFGGAMWILASLALLGLGGYASVLRRWKVEREQAREVVRHLPRPDLEPATDLPERRAVGETVFGDRGRRQEGGGAEAVPVATHPDDPWAPHSGVRIRRWDD
ncbi:MAG: hypothetical protein R3343_06830 [Nitriliruptorales bacterium]|nr:hypothetical protein [Nitriliruptorales bacterium]